MLRWQREVVTLEYGPFFRAHGIAPDKIQRFQDNWVKRTEEDIDLRAAGRVQADAQTTVAALREETKRLYESAQAEALGADDYRQLKDYERTLPLRNTVVLGLAGAAALEGVPLTPQQGEQLFHAAQASAALDRTATGDQLLNAVDWKVLDVQARRILSRAQFALFKSSAPPSGFQSRWKYELDTAVRRAHAADAAPPSAR